MPIKKYTDEELSTIVVQLIHTLYNNPEKILDTFRSNIARKVQSMSLKKMTENEIQESSLKVATIAFKNLNRISTGMVSTKLSREITHKSSQTGIDLSEYKDYYHGLAKDIVKDLIQWNYNQAKKERNKMLKKRK
ncbi:hypothetical protein AS589_07885 [Empedobacter brevis]|uniref:hypothetical protein n=1 Tax=Empedobacter brevis TaxID=247 RepID=UPI00131F7A8D|nr:hypothetical protein [Empedobacter brevis]QHC84712.1 hypothetical protein AS589_07885 [Empedobacter brevis]